MTKPVIVADSSPLIALAVIDQLELLSRLYAEVLIPPAVWDEVTVQGESLPGAQAIRQAQWLTVQVPTAGLLEPLSILVDRGEAEAIALAQGISGSTVPLDDAQARRVAERLGIARIGTLGILRRAKNMGLIFEVKVYIDQLLANGIYIRTNLVEAVLRNVGEMS